MAGNDLTPGELSRKVQELLLQFEGLLRKVEDRYVQKETLELIREGINARLDSLAATDQSLERGKVNQGDLVSLREAVAGKADRSELASIKDDVTDLKDNNKWLVRLVGAFIILGVLGAVFAAGGGGLGK